MMAPNVGQMVSADRPTLTKKKPTPQDVKDALMKKMMGCK